MTEVPQGQTEKKGPQGQTLKQCDRCASAGSPGHLIYFEKIGEDPATKKIAWKVHNEDGKEHEHIKKQGGGQRKFYRTAELIEAKGVQEANAILMGNRMIDYLGHYYDAVSNTVVYVLARKEAAN